MSLQRRLGIALVLVVIMALVVFSARALGRDAQRSPRASRACQTSGLSIRLTHSMAGLGQSGGTLALSNTSSSACTLRGWPRLVTVTAAGHARVAEDVAGASVGTEVHGTPTVVIQPREAAYAVFEGPDGSRSGRPCPPPFHVLKVTPPQNTHSVSISARIPYLDGYLPSCGRIRVSPIMTASSLGAVAAARASERGPANSTDPRRRSSKVMRGVR